ncbi:zinc knuckle-domain-containing protein [Daldinia sp. FL1419]|nr:zinc knuckle-domain-containing protein [Daldinia sp. FL1419]
MYRRGPPKSTPANVQCQKCLKKGHYSYECKAAAQERPYVSRPSRTQQLLNPKLVPKLASDTPDVLQKQKGVADEELAKREAERAKKRELEDDESGDESPKRRRSASYDSVSSISTRRSASPPPRTQQSNAAHPDIPRRGSSRGVRRASYSSASDYERRDPSPPRRSPRNDSPLARSPRRSRSLARDDSPVRSHYDAKDEAPRQRSPYSRRSRNYSSPSRSPPPRERRQFRSRSPEGSKKRDRSPPRDYGRQTYRNSAPNHRNDRRRGEALPRREQRERSLSPFSKRLALTQAMNTGR